MTGAVKAGCAHLGLETDPFARKQNPDEAHRCYANLARERVDLGHQQRFCLARSQRGCPFLETAQRERSADEWMRSWWQSVSPAAATLADRLGRRLRAAEPGAPLALTLVEVVEDEGDEAELELKYEPEPEYEAEPEREQEPEPALEPETVVEAHQAEDLVAAGVALLEHGFEDQAYAAFRKATQRNSEQLMAWFWRAKTAVTLDEVVHCLERAAALAPDNAQVAANLELARGRLTMPKPTKAATRETAAIAVKRPSISWRALGWCREVGRAAAAMAAFVLGAVWLLAALPDQLVHGLIGDVALPTTTALTGMIHLSVAGGYELGTAAPFALGFLALFVGSGLLSGDGWTRLWAPAIGVASAWAWTLGPGANLSPHLLPACGAVVLGGALAGKWSFVRLD